MKAQIHLFPGRLYLAAHTFSTLHQPAFKRHKSWGGISPGESRVNTAGEMSVQEADKPDLGRGGAEAVMSPHFNTPAIALRDI